MGKAIKGINVEKIVIGLKKLKIKIIKTTKKKGRKKKRKKKKKGKLHRTAKSKIEAVVYNNNKKCDCIYTYT